ncbi:unnamed protein product (macronuclear) [Paramecium tetraurelia]|uniref:Myb-like domain-containing protein n=1 Tax=Paramecium tetraurelia TaxID=5888 RepID=A0DPH8_PARTE|nr:uncharacterized protein GSPATT00019127001 [Paramecium tetraurelia]CAK84945.1 unnamed protein product [Paramecium tetraurelia]|eukprot:XP_001452342.1 hypothetical protein (macronuclear) [Paramecium tetraurelia strain d4-2]
MSASKLMYSSPRPKNQSAVSYGGDRDRALSPSRAKISQLTEKLSNLQHSIDEDQAFKKETFEQKVKILEDKNDESKFKLLKEQLSKVEEGAQNEKIIRESDDEKLRTKDLKGLEAYLGKELQGEKIIKKLTIEFIFRLDQARQKKYREETEEKYAEEIGDRVLQLQEEVEEERGQREEQYQQTIKRLGNSILKLQEILTTEKKQREIAQAQMFRMLDEMNVYLNGELNAEKMRERLLNKPSSIQLTKLVIGWRIDQENELYNKVKENIYFLNKYQQGVVQMEEEINFKDSLNNELTSTRSPKSKKIKKCDSLSPKKNVGHWTKEEHEKYLKFLEDNIQMKKNNKIFKPMSEIIGTRSPSQCRSHHQKFNPSSPLAQRKSCKIISASNQATPATTLYEETNATQEDEIQNSNRIKLRFFEEDDMVEQNFNLDDL